MSWMSRTSSEHVRPSRSPLACRICWPLCDSNWTINILFNQINETDQTNQTDLTDQMNKAGWRTFSEFC